MKITLILCTPVISNRSEKLSCTAGHNISTELSAGRLVPLSKTSVHLDSFAQPGPDSLYLLYCKRCSFNTARISALARIIAQSTGSEAECESTGHGCLGDFQQATREETQKQSILKNVLPSQK